VRAVDDDALVARLRRERVTLTVCPLSNLRLGVVGSLAEHPLKRLLDAGVAVTVNSDDPAYFGGYIDDNYRLIQRYLGIDDAQLVQLAGNSFRAAFLSDAERARYLTELGEYSPADR
jgi:adenosine deaminase